MAHPKYYDSNGKEIPSVTTIIKILGKDNLIEWANHLGYDLRIRYKPYMEERSMVGSLVHDRIEREFKGITEFTPHPDYKIEHEIQEKMHNFHIWKEETGVVPLQIEESKSNDRYGGTIDLIGTYKNGLTGLIDFKSGKNIVPSYFLQLGGYLNLINTDDPAMFEKIDFVSIVSLGKGIKVLSKPKKDMALYMDFFEELYMLFMAWRNLLSTDWGQQLPLGMEKVFSKEMLDELMKEDDYD